MTTEPEPLSGLTLLELLVVIAIVGILSSLLLVVISKTKESARRATCVNHLRQITLGVRMYADDMNDTGPAAIPKQKSLDAWTAYKQLVKMYLGQKGAASAEDKVFACPADTYHYDFTASSPTAYAYIPQPVHRQQWSDFSSYAFNGGNSRTNSETGFSFPGIAGRKLTSIKEPSKTVLLAEMPAFYGFSWHKPQNPKLPHYFDNAQNVVAFVDGRVDYIRIYYNFHKGTEAWQYDPAGYQYKWSAD